MIICFFQYCSRAVGTTPSGKWRISRTKPVKPLQSILEESLRWPQSLFNYTKITKKYALLYLYPVKKAMCLYFRHSAAPNGYKVVNYVASLVLYYSPLGDGIGRNVSGWHCRRSSTLNNIGGVRTTSWHIVICSVHLWGVFRVEDFVELICQQYQIYCRKSYLNVLRSNI